MATSVAAVHEELHRLLEERVWRTLEGLVTLDAEAARRNFTVFTEVLHAHMSVEDQLVIPAWRPLAPVEGPGRVDHLEGDHVVLVRLTTEIAGFLPAPADLRATLQRLPSIYRLLGVLEHHTVREATVYRVLDDALPPEVREHLTALLVGLVDRLSDR